MPNPIDLTTIQDERMAKRLRALDEANYKARVPRAASGAAGPEGAPGKAGSQIYEGTGVPSGALGVNGDYYIQTSSGGLYQKQSGVWVGLISLVGPEGPAGAKGATGSTGATGTAGSQILSGTAVPAAGEGANGDYYLRTTTDDLYKKAAGAWSILVNIKGEKGATGPEGPAGGTVKDYGIVTVLPTGTITEGSYCTFKAAAGIFWQLRYTGEATYPWAKIGGPSLRSQYIAAEALTTEATTPQTTNAPSITLPAIKMEATIEYGANLIYAQTAGAVGRMSVFVAGTEVSTFDKFTEVGISATAAPANGRIHRALTASQAVQARYWRFLGTGAIQFFSPFISIDPDRVG